MSKSRILLAGVALFVTLICWSLSSPINSHADERYHIGSIWCANGYDENCLPLGVTESRNEIAFVKLGLCVPIGIQDTYKRLLVDVTNNSCQYERGNQGSLNQFLSSINNRIELNGYIASDFNSAQYPLGYQKLMNVFVTENGAISILIMRAFNSLVFCVLFSLFLFVAKKNIGAYAIMSFLLVSIPHVLFTIASISPVSWAFTGCSLGWLFFFNLLNCSPKSRLRFMMSAVGWLISLALAFSSRYDAIVIFLFTNLSTLALIFWPRLKKVKIKNYAYILPLISLSLYFLGKRVGLIELIRSRFLRIDKVSFYEPWNQLLAIGGTIKVMIATPLRLFGYESLGWLATHVSELVVFSGLILTVTYITKIISKSNYQQIGLLLLIIGFTFGAIYFQIFGQLFRQTDKLPPFYYIRTGWRGDTFFSGRHFISLFMFVIAAPTIFSKKSDAIFQTSTRFVIANILCFTHTISLITVGNIFRNNPDWFWFKSPFGINMITIVGALTFFVFTHFATLFIASSKPISQTLDS